MARGANALKTVDGKFREIVRLEDGRLVYNCGHVDPVEHEKEFYTCSECGEVLDELGSLPMYERPHAWAITLVAPNKLNVNPWVWHTEHLGKLYWCQDCLEYLMEEGTLVTDNAETEPGSSTERCEGGETNPS